MDEETQKRNTDCVYFLASPFTCKKGFVCEYRHSESARLNPRDCWYWLAGNCLNPTCAFRHPPLDGVTETKLEPTSLPHQASVPPMSKTTVPCYFYFNSFCNKGESCAFLHDSNTVTPALKSSKTASTVTSANPLEHRTLNGSDIVQESIKAPPPPTPLETTLKAVENVQFKSKKDLQESAPDNVVDQRSPSPQISMPGYEEAVINSETLLPTEDFIDDRSIQRVDQSSEEQVDGHIESEEWLESSPGFDVLVDDGLGNLDCPDDPNYVLDHESKARGLHDHLFQYDYEDSVGYDPIEYSDAGILYEHGMYDSYDHVENDHVSDYVQRAPKRSREMTLDPMLFQERKLNDQNDLDLRNRLRKHRRIDGRQASHNPRRHGSSRLNDNSQKLARRHGRRHPSRGRVAWEVRKNMLGLQSENDTRSNDSPRHGRSRHSQRRHNRSRQREKESQRQARPPRFISSEISRDTASRETGPTQESTTFAGPKTLAQIKEEKRKARATEDGFENTTRHSISASEDLDRSRLRLMSDDFAHNNNNNNRSKRYHTKRAMNHVHSDKDLNDFVDEDDDEGLEKKLAAILS